MTRTTLTHGEAGGKPLNKRLTLAVKAAVHLRVWRQFCMSDRVQNTVKVVPMTSQTAAPLSIAICVPTYQRNKELTELLNALSGQARPPADHARVRVIVIDNNPGADARCVVEAHVSKQTGLDADHVHETRPGVTHVRNRALDETMGDDLLVFIDDDELPDTGWLLALWSCWHETRAAAVFGTVDAYYEVPPQGWISDGNFHAKPVTHDGPRRAPGGTDNCLIDLSAVRRHGARFDPALSLIGGEDTLFFDGLLRAGEVFANAASARTFERIPENRATLGWLTTRWRRTGMTDALMISRRRGGGSLAQLRAGLDGLVRIVIAGPLVAGSWLLAGGQTDVRGARYMYTFQRGLGMVDFARGRIVQEYARPAAPPGASKA